MNTPLETTTNLIDDTIVLLRAAGVSDISYSLLDNLLHKKVKADKLTSHADALFKKRKKDTVITFRFLLESFESSQINSKST